MKAAVRRCAARARRETRGTARDARSTDGRVCDPRETRARRVPRAFVSRVLAETRVSLGRWTSVAVRVWTDDPIPHAEVEWTVGPIPVELDGAGKEVIMRYSTGLDTGG